MPIALRRAAMWSSMVVGLIYTCLVASSASSCEWTWEVDNQNAAYVLLERLCLLTSLPRLPLPLVAFICSSYFFNLTALMHLAGEQDYMYSEDPFSYRWNYCANTVGP